MFRTLLTAIPLMTVTAAFAAWPTPDQLPVRPELPDPLVFFDGRRVSSPEQWHRERRPELKDLFQHYMYGYLPPAVPVAARVEYTNPQALDGKALLQEVSLAFGPPETPKLHVLLLIPKEARTPVPCFVGINFAGNHAVLKDPGIRLPTAWIYPHRTGVVNGRATEQGRGTEFDNWGPDTIIQRGYALATFYNGDIDPDQKEVRAGIQKSIAQLGGTRPGPTDWGTIAAWAWGMHRAVDYLVTRPELDARRLVAVGHSRLGKTALLATAFDDRIAMAIPNQAGCGGTAPSRCHNPKAETVQRINTAFPHWFNGHFKLFNTQTDRLPFDQNGLIALCAPRPVLVSNAVEDQWANPAGQFDVLKAADPVYRFLGVEGLGANSMPEPGQLINTRLGYFIRPGVHSMTRVDWQAFLDFADRNLPKPNP